MIAVDEEYADDDTPISPGSRLAVIPPVSGGAGVADREDRPTMIEITAEPIDHAAVTERVRSPLAGAVCTFLGTVREITGDRRTVALAYESYPEMALKKMAELEEEARRRWPVIELALVHRVGDLDLGEVSVVVAVSCPHRQRVVRSVPVADRYAQGSRPDLEEGNLGRRQRRVDPSGSAPELRPNRPESDTQLPDVRV